MQPDFTQPVVVAGFTCTSNLNTSEAGPAADPIESTSRRQDGGLPAQKRLQAQVKKKFEFITSLTNHLDILIYAQLSIIYYMEFVQLIFLLYFC